MPFLSPSQQCQSTEDGQYLPETDISTHTITTVNYGMQNIFTIWKLAILGNYGMHYTEAVNECQNGSD